MARGRDLLMAGDGVVTLADFKTDAWIAEQRDQVLRLYGPQRAAHAAALRRVGITQVVERLILLREQGAEAAGRG
jgi:hypothetical protein